MLKRVVVELGNRIETPANLTGQRIEFSVGRHSKDDLKHLFGHRMLLARSIGGGQDIKDHHISIARQIGGPSGQNDGPVRITFGRMARIRGSREW